MEIFAIRIKDDGKTLFTYDNTSYYGFLAKTHTIAIIDASIGIIDDILMTNNTCGTVSYKDQDFSLGCLYIDRNSKYTCYIMCGLETHKALICDLMHKISILDDKIESINKTISIYNKNPKKFMEKLETGVYQPHEINETIIHQLFDESNKLLNLLAKSDKLTAKTKSYLPKSSKKK